MLFNHRSLNDHRICFPWVFRMVSPKDSDPWVKNGNESYPYGGEDAWPRPRAGTAPGLYQVGPFRDVRVLMSGTKAEGFPVGVI